MQSHQQRIREWRKLYRTLYNEPPGGWAALLADSYRRSMGAWRSDYKRYLRSAAWARVRRRAKQQAGGTCTQCSARRTLECHHLTYVRAGAERDEDVCVLCRSCHQLQHASKHHAAPTPRLNAAQRLSARQRQVDGWKSAEANAPRHFTAGDMTIRRRPRTEVCL